MSTHLAVCPHDCPDTCSMVVTVEDGKATQVRGNASHSYTRGFLCHKVSRYPERVYHPGRLIQPMMRTGAKGEGKFTPISWDQALDRITTRFQEIANSVHGPQAILPYSYAGTMGKIQSQSIDRRFFHRLGASLLDRTICATAGGAGFTYTIGSRRGMQPEAFSESKYIINWGSNSVVTNSHLWVRMVEARKRGAKIVTIDPYLSETANRSDWHIAPKVGTDAALALGMMHVIFRDGLEDRDYLENYTIGHAELRERVLQEYSPEKVAGITGLSVETIVQFAHEYARTKPTAIRINYGMQRHRGGGMAVRTITCLPAVVGAWRDWAGGILLSTSANFPINARGLERPDLIPPGTRTINMVQLAEALNGELPGPPVQAMYVYNCNPAAVSPNQKKVIEGLRREDLFLVVHELFATDTVDYADIVLPATSQLEHFDIHTAYGHDYVQVNVPCIQPLGEARSNSTVFRQLASRLGFEEKLFQISDEDLAREALWEFSDKRPEAFEGITVDRLKAEGPQRLRIPRRYAPYEKGNFATASGRCELLCPTLEKLGFDPLPTYLPPAENSDSMPELAEEFPLQFISPPSPHFLNSSFVNIDSLRESADSPELEIHPSNAQERDIVEGSLLRIFNRRGEFKARARLSEKVRPGLVMSPSIWWNKYSPSDSNVNAVTPTTLTDFGGGATFHDCLVEVEVCAE